MKKKKDEITIRSSAAEYLTYVVSVGDQQDSVVNKTFVQMLEALGYDIELTYVKRD